MSGCGGWNARSGSQGDQGLSPTYPRRPIKLIVPFAAGGGSDTFGRIIQSAIEEKNLLPQPLVIINVPGAGGTIGSRRVKNALADGYTLLLLHEGILTAKHSGSASYGAEAFTPIAGTGETTQVIAVAGSSPYQDLASLIDASRQAPDAIVFSANIGAPSHFAGLMLEAESPGAAFRYTQNGGGAKRFAALQGGHVDVSAFSIAEYVQFQSSGIRALALLGSERHPDLPELATAREQGFNVISQNMQFWWAPVGTAADRVDVIADALTAAMETPEVRAKLKDMKTADLVLRGDRLKSAIEQRDARIAAVAPAAAIELPDFALIVFTALAFFATLSIVQAVRRKPSELVIAKVEPGCREELAGFAVLTILYVVILQFQLAGFVWATAVYTILGGAVLMPRVLRRRRIRLAKAVSALIAMGVVMSIGLHFLFTKVLVVDLP